MLNQIAAIHGIQVLPMSGELLVVAGGGSGGTAFSGGGGGAGGVCYQSSRLLSGSFTVTIGAGGSAPSSDGNSNGTNSIFDTVTAIENLS